jgi:hypothetical protein
MQGSEHPDVQVANTGSDSLRPPTFMQDLDLIPQELIPAKRDGVGCVVDGGHPTDITSLVQQEIRAVDPDLGVYDAQSMESVLDQAVAAPRLNSALLWVFAAMALVLSAVGVYGVTAYAVTGEPASSRSASRLVRPRVRCFG